MENRVNFLIKYAENLIILSDIELQKIILLKIIDKVNLIESSYYRGNLIIALSKTIRDCGLRGSLDLCKIQFILLLDQTKKILDSNIRNDVLNRIIIYISHIYNNEVIENLLPFIIEVSEINDNSNDRINIDESIKKYLIFPNSEKFGRLIFPILDNFHLENDNVISNKYSLRNIVDSIYLLNDVVFSEQLFNKLLNYLLKAKRFLVQYRSIDVFKLILQLPS